MDAAVRRQNSAESVSLMKPALRVRGVTKRFGADTAVDAVDLDVEAGGFTCLIGPSGCGKTTLLRIVAGLERQTKGCVEIQGRDVSARPPSDRGVGMVFQSYALFPNLTVAENIAFGMRGRAERRTHVEALLATVDLPGYGPRLPRQLSGGQQQRVAIARALATNPKILLLDEPLSALDPLIREQLRGELKALQRRLGVTTVMVTHDQAEALAVGDRIAVMRGGRVVQTGAPEDVYDRPADAFVAGFVGAANLLEAEVEGPDTLRLWGAAAIGAATAGHAPGTRLTAVIRPEAVRLAANGEAGLRAIVVGRVFTGPAVRIEAAPLAAPDQRLIADVPAGPQIPDVGAAVDLVLPQERLRLLPERAA
jgi:iron(III) transport system ATP-binding protein